MSWEVVKVLTMMGLKATIDVVVQFLLLFAFIYVTATLGIVAITLEFIDGSLVRYYRRSNMKDTIVEKTVFTSIFDFLEQFLIVIRGFIERRQEELSSINIHTVNRIEILRQRFAQEENSQTTRTMQTVANFKEMGTEL